MDKEEILAVLGVVLGLPTLVQICPIKINPWSWLWKMLKRMWLGFCRSLTAPVLAELEPVMKEQLIIKQTLEAHIAADDKREADHVRASILRFNNEVMRSIPHTEEEFVEVLASIDWYERYCRDHKDYKNSRAVHAIDNIERVYDERLKNNDFL